jgi:hypothetical protein
MPNVPHVSGYYFAQQSAFQNLSDVGYTGLQPREDSSSGESIVHAVLSSFVAGITTSDPNCSEGTDGGPGVSCAVDIESLYSDSDILEVKNVSVTTWRGTRVNGGNGDETRIGEWNLPEESGGIERSQVEFEEYYPWNSGTHQCGDLPYTDVLFGVPSSETVGVGEGTLGYAYEYGDCVGKVGFDMERDGEGDVVVMVGFM